MRGGREDGRRWCHYENPLYKPQEVTLESIVSCKRSTNLYLIINMKFVSGAAEVRSAGLDNRCRFFLQAIVLAALAASTLAAPQHNPDADAQVLRSDFENIGVDGFKYA